MLNKGWRTVVINNNVNLEYEQGTMLVVGDEKVNIPINQIKTLIINSQQTRLTTYLMTELCNNNVKTIFCNQKHNPVSELMGYYDNCQTAGRTMTQSQWKDTDKSILWRKIVSSKIENQNKLLIHRGFGDNSLLNKYLNEVEENDLSNREGQAARVYFNAIFGKKFIRHNEDPTNSLLNYGYAILLSSVNRIVTAYGYSTCLGIKHCNANNPYNLSSDLMEPFRPFVDNIILNHSMQTLTKENRKKLIEANYMHLKFDNQQMDMQSALESFISQVLTNVNNHKFIIPKMEFMNEK